MPNRLEFFASLDATGFQRGILQIEAAADATNARLQRMLQTKIAAVTSRMGGMDPNSWEYSQASLRRKNLENTLLNAQNSGFLRNAEARQAIRQREIEQAAKLDAERVAANRAALDAIIVQEREAAVEEGLIWDQALLQDEIRAATRANQARALYRQRAQQRLADAVQAEQAATAGVFWFSGKGTKDAAAAATAEREAAQQRLANLTSTAFAAEQVAKSLGNAAHESMTLTGSIRETMVIFREIAAGRGLARITSSATLLGQYLWKGFLTALLSIPGLVFAAGAAIYYFVHEDLKKLNEALDNTAEAASETFGDHFHAYVDTLQDAARAAGELNDRLKELGKTHETLKDQMDGVLQGMEEEFQLQQEIAQSRGQTKAEELAAEQDLRKRQLAVIEQTLQKQKEEAAAAKQADIDASAAAFTSQEAIARNEAIRAMPSEMDKAQEDAKKYGPMVDDLQNFVEQQVAAAAKGNFWTDAQKQNERNYWSSQPQMVKDANGKNEYISLDAASAYLKSADAIIADMPKQMAKLSETQREYADAAQKAAEADTKAADAVPETQKQRDDMAKTIAKHDKYDPQIAAADSKSDSGKVPASARAPIPTDSLISTGNFLGTAKGKIESIQQKTNEIAQKHLEATKQMHLTIKTIANNTRPRVGPPGENHYPTH